MEGRGGEGRGGEGREGNGRAGREWREGGGGGEGGEGKREGGRGLGREGFGEGGREGGREGRRGGREGGREGREGGREGKKGRIAWRLLHKLNGEIPKQRVRQTKVRELQEVKETYSTWMWVCTNHASALSPYLFLILIDGLTDGVRKGRTTRIHAFGYEFDAIEAMSQPLHSMKNSNMFRYLCFYVGNILYHQII